MQRNSGHRPDKGKEWRLFFNQKTLSNCDFSKKEIFLRDSASGTRTEVPKLLESEQKKKPSFSKGTLICCGYQSGDQKQKKILIKFLFLFFFSF